MNYNIYKQLFKNLPEKTISDKIVKLRYIYNLERAELASIINCHVDTIITWEESNIMPKPYNIKSICDLFKIDFGYFDEYYKVFFSDYNKEILKWKANKKLTYQQLSNLLCISESGLKRIVNKKISLSFEMYIKLKDNKII